MNYMQVSKDYFLDTERRVFISEIDLDESHEECSISVPFYLWDYDEEERHIKTTWYRSLGGKLKKAVKTYTKCNYVWLNQLELRFRPNYEQLSLQFMDKVQKRWVQLHLSTTLYVAHTSKSRTGIKTVGASFKLQADGNQHVSQYDFDCKSWRPPNFRYIDGFMSVTDRESDNQFMFGLSPKPYDICYKGRKLNGDSLALLVGPYAILLGDDLSFDSIVFLNGAAKNMLDVASFPYTVNPYIMKVKLAMK